MLSDMSNLRQRNEFYRIECKDRLNELVARDPLVVLVWGPFCV